MVAQTPVVDGVLHARDLVPGVAVVLGAEDGEPDEGRLRAVVLPGCEDVARGELRRAGVEDARVGVVGGRREDDSVGEGGRGGGLGEGVREGENGEEGEEAGEGSHSGRLGWKSLCRAGIGK